MTVIYDTDEDGNIIVAFDSRWRFPEILGYSPKDPRYKALQGLWEKATGEKIQALKSPGIRKPEEVMMRRRLTRDRVISVVKGKELVGICRVADCEEKEGGGCRVADCEEKNEEDDTDEEPGERERQDQ